MSKVQRGAEPCGASHLLPVSEDAFERHRAHRTDRVGRRCRGGREGALRDAAGGRAAQPAAG